MNLLLTIRVALRALGKNKLRACLTVLGVVMGVAAVTTMVSIGQSAGDMVESELEGFGSNVLVVFSGSGRGEGVRRGRGTNPTLTPEDAEAVARECPSVLAVTPIVGTREHIVYGNTNWAPDETVGADTDFPVVRNWGLRLGGFFTKRDVNTAAKVCVIGQTIVEELFQTQNPIGEKIRIKNIPFLIIGVLEAKGANIVGRDQDNVVVAPYTTIRKRIRGSEFEHVDVIMVSARTSRHTREAQQEIELLLAERHKIGPGDKPDFHVQNTTEIAQLLNIVTGAMTALLAAIAGISLLVGGVGIMNIMLVSVTERTREIGLRMAVGASPETILLQFLVESVLLSLMGGFVGLALGTGASAAITLIINSFTIGTPWPIVISFQAAALAIAFSVSVGVFFGYYPARRASRLDPIDALRYE